MESFDLEKEKNEAISAGYAALRTLNEAKEKLSSARGWGIYDTFFGGGLISSAIKHSKMDDAKYLIDDAQRKLQIFNDELQDLKLSGINLETFDLLGMADLLFDGFLWDMLTQGRIADARNAVDDAIIKVNNLLAKLDTL